MIKDIILRNYFEEFLVLIRESNMLKSICQLSEKLLYGNRLLFLRKYKVYHKKLLYKATDPVLYLTIDVEWENVFCMERILDVLKEKNVCAFLFVMGNGTETHLNILKRFWSEGHLVGNHTMNHKDLTECSQEELNLELSSCYKKIFSLTGKKLLKVMRPPYGRINQTLAKKLYDLGYVVLHWSLHVPDYREEQPTWENFREYFDENLHNGGIILQHSFSTSTAENMDKIIDYCREKGYRFANYEDYSKFFIKKNW